MMSGVIGTMTSREAFRVRTRRMRRSGAGKHGWKRSRMKPPKIARHPHGQEEGITQQQPYLSANQRRDKQARGGYIVMMSREKEIAPPIV